MAVNSISASGRCTLLDITSMEKRPGSGRAGYRECLAQLQMIIKEAGFS
jgi:hypothetical protein